MNYNEQEVVTNKQYLIPYTFILVGMLLLMVLLEKACCI